MEKKMYGIKVGDDHKIGINGSVIQIGNYDIFSKKEAEKFINECDLHRRDLKIVELS